jgi:hemerythrin-like domain-containing protein
MNPIDELKKEHEDIERELVELETIMQEQEVNYSNLIHTFRKLHNLWNLHEEKEERIFPILEKEKIKVPVEKMLFEHKLLRPHKEKMWQAINSGKENMMKKSLSENAVIIIKLLRKHIKDEDEILYTITLQEFTPEELKELWEKSGK